VFSVVFIVRNEERSLPIAIRSLGNVPEVVVCDTGSADGTVREARALGATVCEYEWSDDFSAARAFAAGQARFDWIVRFDADERLDVISPAGDPIWLSKAISYANDEGAAMACIRREHAPGFVHWFPRCYRRSLWSWRYPVHELLVSQTGRRLPIVAADGAVVRHRPAPRRRPYREILERAVLSAPSDPHLLYYLGRACVDEGLWAEALRNLDAYLASEGGYRWHRSEGHLLRARVLTALSHVDTALQSYESAHAACDPRAEPLHEAAILAARSGCHGRATRYIDVGRNLEIPQELQLFGKPDVPYVIDVQAYKEPAWQTTCSIVDQQRC
jgi:tetratricopeptide (TPR) repeat protein